MYSLDVNFLNDRAAPGEGSGARPLPGDNRPIYAGIGVAGGLLALVGGLWLLLQTQNASLQSQQQQLDSQLAELNSQLEQVKAIRGQIDQVTNEANALATVFNQIKPWSAMLQDIRERTPEGVQIQSITQAEPSPPPTAATPTPSPSPSPTDQAAGGATPSPTPTATPIPTAALTVSGVARSFSDVNDFVLVLQKSPFLKETDTKLLKAELVNNPIQIDLSQAKLQTGAVVNLPKVVAYTIQSSISDVPASELIAELNSNGAVGLVNRIETLRTKGVIKP